MPRKNFMLRINQQDMDKYDEVNYLIDEYRVTHRLKTKFEALAEMVKIASVVNPTPSRGALPAQADTSRLFSETRAEATPAADVSERKIRKQSGTTSAATPKPKPFKSHESDRHV